MAIHNEKNMKQKEIDYKKSLLASMVLEAVLFSAIFLVGYLIPHEVFGDLVFDAKKWSAIYLLSLAISILIVLLDLTIGFVLPSFIQYRKKGIINYQSIIERRINPQTMKEKFFHLVAKVCMLIAFITFVFSQVVLYVFVL